MAGAGETGDSVQAAGVQVVGMLAHGWTATMRGAFLDALAECGRADVAARRAGVSLAGAYAHRRRNAGFAADWQQALTAIYDRLEAVVLEEVLRGAGGKDFALSTALVLLERRPIAAVPVAPVAAKATRTAERARGEAELLRRLKAYAKRTGTPEPA